MDNRSSLNLLFKALQKWVVAAFKKQPFKSFSMFNTLSEAAIAR